VNLLTIAELIQTFPHAGKLVWVGTRPARGEPMISVTEAMADQCSGLIGDRYNVASGKRQVTFNSVGMDVALERINGPNHFKYQIFYDCTGKG